MIRDHTRFMSEIEITTTPAQTGRSVAAEVLWLYFPDYGGSVPYQPMLAQAFPRSIISRPGTIAEALASMDRRRTVFHLHWEDALYAGAASELDAATEIAASLDQLAGFRARGGVLIWTMHNAAPHEDRFPELSARLRTALASMADLVHVHSSTGQNLALALGAPRDRVLSCRIPNLAPAYPNDIDDHDARRYFDLDNDTTVFACIGANRGYKDLGLLRDAFAALHAMQPRTTLILAGRQASYLEQRYVVPEPGVRLIPRFVDDAVIQYILHAADFVVLPYRRILTSGALSLSLGFGRPVIIPDIPALLEIVDPGQEGLAYTVGDVSSLLDVLTAAAAMPRETRAQMRQHALTEGRRVNFADLAACLYERLAPTVFGVCSSVEFASGPPSR